MESPKIMEELANLQSIQESASGIYTGVDPMIDLRWYAIYTRSHHEKRVCDELHRQEIEHYLPLICEYRRWSDRKKKVELPLIRSYVFVHITLRETLYVIDTPSVVRFVTFKKELAPIPDFQIEALKRTIDSGYQLHPSDYLGIGQLVEVTEGSLKGVIGRIQRIENVDNFVIALDAIQAAFTVAVKPGYLKPVSEEKKQKLLSLPLGLDS